MLPARRPSVNRYAHRGLQLAAGAACALIVLSALAGTNRLTTATSQVLDYTSTTTPPTTPKAGTARGEPGVSTRVEPVSVRGYSGPVLVCRRPGVGCRELTRESLVRIGAYLDTTRGAARLDTARANGTFTGTVVYAGLFRLEQARRARSLLTARVQGRLPRLCPPHSRGGSLRAGASAGKRKSRGPRRRLWSDGKGRFRATGRYGSATVRGTKFLIEERCSGTFVRVLRGSVDVEDRPRHRSVVVRAPRSYLIRAPG